MTIIETLLLSLFAGVAPEVPPIPEAPPVTESQDQNEKGPVATDPAPAAKDAAPRTFTYSPIRKISNGY